MNSKMCIWQMINKFSTSFQNSNRASHWRRRTDWRPFDWVRIWWQFSRVCGTCCWRPFGCVWLFSRFLCARHWPRIVAIFSAIDSRSHWSWFRWCWTVWRNVLLIEYLDRSAARRVLYVIKWSNLWSRLPFQLLSLDLNFSANLKMTNRSINVIFTYKITAITVVVVIKL